MARKNVSFDVFPVKQPFFAICNSINLAAAAAAEVGHYISCLCMLIVNPSVL